MSDKVVPIREITLEDRVAALEAKLDHLCEALRKLGVYEEPEVADPPQEQTEPEE